MTAEESVDSGAGGSGGGGGDGRGTPQDLPPVQGERNDCLNMANDAQRIANSVIAGRYTYAATSARAVLMRFNRTFSTRYAGDYPGEGVLGNLHMPIWGSSSQTRADFGQRGFPQQFRDDEYPDDAADQTHHFAAYFAGAVAGHRITLNIHRSFDNQGDANLGLQAQLLGNYLRNNPRQLSNIGRLIRETICEGKAVPR